MSTKGSWAATDASALLVAASTTRDETILQHTNGDAVYLAFGEAAVVGQGIVLSSDMPVIIISDHRAGEAIYAICDTGESASGTWAGDR